MDLTQPHIPLVVSHHEKTYSDNIIMTIRIVYIVMAVFWVLIVYLLALYQIDWLGYIFLIVPFVVFFINYINAGAVDPATEVEIFQANYLSIGLIIVLPLLSWMNKEHPGDKKKFMSIMVVALVLIMLSMVDVWVSRQWLSVLRHIQSGFQTIALVLLIYAIYYFYVLSPAGFVPGDMPGGMTGMMAGASSAAV